MVIRVQKIATETPAMHSLLLSAMTGNRNLIAGTFAMMTMGLAVEAENLTMVICYHAMMNRCGSMIALNRSMMIRSG